MTENVKDTGAPQQGQGHFLLQRIYQKNASFEAPGAPVVFTREWKAETQVQFSSGSSRISENQYEATLRVTVTATNEGKPAFVAESEMAGIFLIDGLPPAALERTLGTMCPNILFPYVREAISDQIARGTFPQLLLTPMNFDAIYADAKRRQQEKGAPAQQPAH